MKNLIKKHFIALPLVAACFVGQAAADIAIITHPATEITFDQDEVKRLFLRKLKPVIDNEPIVPVSQSRGSDTRKQFNDVVLDKTENNLKSYWAKLIFTGKGKPPKERGADEDILRIVGNNPGIIGYVDARSIDENPPSPPVKVILRITSGEIKKEK